MGLVNTAIEDDNDFRRQVVFFARSGAGAARNDVAQKPIGRGEDTAREIDRISNRNEKLLVDDIHRQVTENNLASDPATSPVARMIAA